MAPPSRGDWGQLVFSVVRRGKGVVGSACRVSPAAVFVEAIGGESDRATEGLRGGGGGGGRIPMDMGDPVEEAVPEAERNTTEVVPGSEPSRAPPPWGAAVCTT